MIFEKPDRHCGGCELYKEDCHCLCHSQDIMNGYHEIVYNSGPAPILNEHPSERE
jgi:hypothetical protein